MKNYSKTFSGIVMILLLLSVIPHTSRSSGYINSEEPLVVYNAITTPEIDGIIARGEWNDTKHYSYEPSRVSCSVECALKHDEHWLYILFSIKDYDSTYLSSGPNDSLIIYTKTYGDVGIDSLRPNESVYSVVMVYNTGTSWEGYLGTSSYISTGVPANATGACQYTNNIVTFEVMLNLSYYNTSNHYVPFNLQYYPYFGHSFPIGCRHTMRPGMIISKSYYTEEPEPGNASWPIAYVILLVAVAVGSSGLTSVYMKKRISRQRDKARIGHPPAKDEEAVEILGEGDV